VVVSRDFVYKNQFAIEIDTYIKIIEQNKSKKILYKVTCIKNIIKKYNLYKIYKINYKWIILTFEKTKQV
jgi:hypothetical protein